MLVVPVWQLSWQRVALPKVAPARLRAALDGLLEEHLLDDTAQLHFALEPGARPGQAAGIWVAACRRDWLQAQLRALEQAGRPASRIVPAASPQAKALLYPFVIDPSPMGALCAFMPRPLKQDDCPVLLVARSVPELQN